MFSFVYLLGLLDAGADGFFLFLYLPLSVSVYRAGIDGGGVFKEFFTSLSKEVFDTNRGLWLTTAQNELYPNPHSYATESKCERR